MHAPSQCWTELSWTTLCSQGFGFILCFSWHPNCWLLVCWLFKDLNVAFHESGCFSFIGLGKLSGLSWDLEFAAVSTEQLMRAFMPCLQDMSTCGEVLVSLLCYLVASFTRFWFQLLRKNVSDSACKELHVHLGLFSCVCFNFVFCNFLRYCIQKRWVPPRMCPGQIAWIILIPKEFCWDLLGSLGVP